MHIDQYRIERQVGLDAGQDFVAKAFVNRSYRGARGRGEGRQPFDHRPAARLGGFAPDMQRRGEIGGLVPGGVAAPHAVFLVSTPSGREGHELVGLGAEGSDEDPLGQDHSRWRWQPTTWSSTMPEACMKA
jgi:hypothetical protein